MPGERRGGLFPANIHPMGTILIVDDSVEDRQVLELMIKNFTGHRTLTAATGREALALAPRADLILLDIKLPDYDGREVLKLLRTRPETAKTPALFLTAFPMAQRDAPAESKDGPVDYLIKPVRKENLVNQINLLLTIRDAHNRFQSRGIAESDQLTLLLAALGQTGDGITVTDWKGRWLFVNNSQAAMFGYHLDEFFALSSGDLYLPESADRLNNEIIPYLKEFSHWEGELQARKKEGAAFPILLSLAVIKDDSGKFLGIMGITKDISGIKKALEELKNAQEELVRTERMKALGEMVGGMAHEFNNLLAIILGNSQIMLQSEKTPSRQKRLRAIERAAFTGAEAVKRLQAFAFSHPDEAVDTFDLKELLEEALRFCRPRWRNLAQRKGVRIEVASDLLPSLTVRAKREELKTAFVNIITNSIEALNGGGSISVRSWTEDIVACVEVRDNGTGMTPDIKKRIFDPFFTTLRPLKTGLGLSMAYGIVQKYSGTIEVESEPGQGTSVTVRLPRFQPADEKPEAPAGTADGRKEPVRILIIDNDRNILDLLSDILSQAGFEVRVQPTSPAGLEEALNSDYQLVITDLGMPEIGGLELATRIKREKPRVKVALITGWWISLQPEEITRSGADAVWSKPFDLKAILREVERLVAAPRAGREKTPPGLEIKISRSDKGAE